MDRKANLHEADAAAHADVDVAIVGAGISGIAMAAHLGMACPNRSYAIIERRARAGGTWDLFRYPGVRSDSDMYTLGFGFAPWRHGSAIAQGEAIRRYLDEVIDQRGMREHIRFGSRVVAANWDSGRARWIIAVERDDGTGETVAARWLHLGAGYYDYDEAYDAGIPGREDFGGTIVRPQFWPEGFDYAGRKVVVIGSGATAATLVPAMARDAAHVTMLQRTPSWYLALPTRDRVANVLRRLLPAGAAHAALRFRSVRMQHIVFRCARSSPARAGRFLLSRVKRALGARFDPAAFTPPYGLWEQRLCVVPDGDLFEAIKDGRADIVTDRIERIDAGGIRLESGRHVEADVIVMATGLKLAVGGKIALSCDGEPIDLSRRFFYSGAMFSNIPNLSLVFGYLSASWTLRAELVARWVCAVLNRMAETGAQVATPVLDDDTVPPEETEFGFSSGYLVRSLDILPRNARKRPWRLGQNYLADRAWMKAASMDDGILTLTGADEPETADREPCAATRIL